MKTVFKNTVSTWIHISFLPKYTTLFLNIILYLTPHAHQTLQLFTEHIKVQVNFTLVQATKTQKGADV